MPISGIGGKYEWYQLVDNVCNRKIAELGKEINRRLERDATGIGTYKYLDHDFDEKVPLSHKVHKTNQNIHLVLLPIPGEMSQYLKDEQALNYFEIEHLLGHEYLRKMEMIVESELKDDIFKIKDSTGAKKQLCK